MISISLIRRGFHSSRVSLKRSSWFRRRGRIKSNGAVVEKVDEPTEESDANARVLWDWTRIF